MPEQVWPAFANPPHTAPEIACGKIGVGANDLRVLAAQLEHAALHPAGALLADASADLDRSREEDLAGGGLDERPADSPAPVHGLEQTLGKSRALEHLLYPLADQAA